jgi:hypothetical protein
MNRNNINRYLASARVESLEPRALLSATFLGATVLPRLSLTPTLNISTSPANGDLNPYGVAFVPQGFAKGGPLAAGDILVSNFNSSSNLQGTGTTIDRITPGGALSTFFQGPSGLGLTTALGVLKSGFVVVGNMPTTDGTSATVQPGSLIVLDKTGTQVLNLTDSTNINGPWDLAVHDSPVAPQVFISNVLTGTVSRLNFKISHGKISLVSSTQIASGYTHRADPSALELGPTGLVFDSQKNTLFVASTADGAIYAIPRANTAKADTGLGTTVSQDGAHLHGPLGMTQAPNGDLIVANGDALNADPNQPSELVEFTRTGAFVAQFSISSSPAAPFGIALASTSKSITLAAVNDDDNMLQTYTITPPGPFLPSPVVTRLSNVQPTIVSTVPSNGDLNPYGVTFVPKGFAKGGTLAAGDILVSNFNSSSNLQGTGTTIDSITPGGALSVFFQGASGLGLTTALGVLKSGFVVVGNMPTTDGTSATVQAGSLIVLNKTGTQVLNLTNSTTINGPWDLAVHDSPVAPQVFISNVLSGTVSRLNFKISHGTISLVSSTQIASGYTHRADPAALELGPTGLVFDTMKNTLFVVSTIDGVVYAIPHANTTKVDNGLGKAIYQDTTHLHGPLGMTQAPNGDLIVANGDALNADPNQPSELVEITRTGSFVGQFSIDSDPAAPFGLALSFSNTQITLAAVNDDTNMLQIYTLNKTT